MHITFANVGGTGLRLPFNATVWIGFALMMAIAMWPAARGVIHYSAFHKGLGLLLLALLLPFLWSWNEASLIALPRMLTVTAGAILLLGIAQLPLTRRDWWWIGMAILAGALLETAFGYVQLYLLEPGNWLGYDPTAGRPYGIFQQVNVMASFLVTGLVISGWLIGEARNRLEGGVILLAPLFMPALILVIQSRTGWLAALIAVPLVMVHLWHLDRARFRAWSGALTVGCVLAAIIWWAPWAEAGYTSKAVSAPGERLPVYLHSLKMIAQEPLTGWGYGRFQHDFLHSFADWRAALPVNQPEIVEPIITQNYAHPHNELLYWGIEGGLLPVLAIVGFAGWVSWRLWAHGPERERLLFTALLLPVALHAMTEFPFYHSLVHWLVFLLLLGLVASSSWQTKTRTNRYTLGIRAGAWLVVPIVWIFMASHLQALWQVKSFHEARGQNAGALARVINPLGIPQDLEYLVMLRQLSTGRAETYRQWAENEAKLLPSAELYSNLIIAYEITAQKDVDIQQRFKHLFPHVAQQIDESENTELASEPTKTL
ncbi:PglL family O-oligosaccharyltransferase [Halomonas aquatica]|uniref:Wzy polymerase domain-containing protein n=1 Tax=Halomonas aquatica TaxID=3151123 RepID=A0ABV1NEX9_9GAMM